LKGEIGSTKLASWASMPSSPRPTGLPEYPRATGLPSPSDGLLVTSTFRAACSRRRSRRCLASWCGSKRRQRSLHEACNALWRLRLAGHDVCVGCPWAGAFAVAVARPYISTKCRLTSTDVASRFSSLQTSEVVGMCAPYSSGALSCGGGVLSRGGGHCARAISHCQSMPQACSRSMRLLHARRCSQARGTRGACRHATTFLLSRK